MFMPVQQAKVPVLHFFAPCSPQGLQAGRGSASMTRLSLLKGPKPKSGVVEQNTAVTGASTAEQEHLGFRLVLCHEGKQFDPLFLAHRLGFPK